MIISIENQKFDLSSCAEDKRDEILHELCLTPEGRTCVKQALLESNSNEIFFKHKEKSMGLRINKYNPNQDLDIIIDGICLQKKLMQKQIKHLQNTNHDDANKCLQEGCINENTDGWENIKIYEYD